MRLADCLLWRVIAALAGLGCGAAQAGTLDRVRADGVLHCGAAPRAGVADLAEDGRVSGLAVDLCRALSVAVLGPAGRAAFRLYQTGQDYDRVRAGQDDVAFVDAAAVQSQGLAARLVPGPVVFVAELTTLAQPGVTALAGRTICFMNGSPAHQALEAWAAHTGTPFVRSGYQEDGEMHDAFDAHRCDAMAGEATELAEIRAGLPGRNAAHVLPPLGLAPVFAASPIGDGAWAALVGWTVGGIVQSEAAPSPWRGDLPGADFPGLRPGWQQAVVAAVGTYGAMTRRAFGPDSELGLQGGANALWPEGLILPPGPR